MVGKPGRSGTNKGAEKPFRDALRLAINEAQDDKKRLRLVAEKLIERAETGDVQAIKEIADRLDGKSVQQSEHGGLDGGPIRHTFEWLTTDQPSES